MSMSALRVLAQRFTMPHVAEHLFSSLQACHHTRSKERCVVRGQNISIGFKMCRIKSRLFRSTADILGRSRRERMSSRLSIGLYNLQLVILLDQVRFFQPYCYTVCYGIPIFGDCSYPIISWFFGNSPANPTSSIPVRCTRSYGGGHRSI